MEFLYRDEEQFSNYFGHGLHHDTTLDNLFDDLSGIHLNWNWDSEVQINPDLGLIGPIAGNLCDINIRDANSATNVNVQLNDGLQPLLDIEPPKEDISNQAAIMAQCDLNLQDPIDFGIKQLPRQHSSVGKKIDMAAMKYIIDEEDVDVETISECGDHKPATEEFNFESLLKEFEAIELPDLDSISDDFLEQTLSILSKDSSINITEDDLFDEGPIKNAPAVNPGQLKEVVDVKIKEENLIDIPVIQLKTCDNIEHTTSQVDQLALPIQLEILKDEENLLKPEPVEILGNLDVKTERKEYSIQDVKDEKVTSKSNITTHKQNKKTVKNNVGVVSKEFRKGQKPKQANSTICATNPSSSYIKPVSTSIKNRQIRNSLPQELINRINNSSKRKGIPVIEPIVPIKKSRVCRTVETSSHVARTCSKSKIANHSQVLLEHNYCLKKPNPITKNAATATNVAATSRIATNVAATNIVATNDSGTNVVAKHNLKKDSGFESGEEEKRTVIGKQPTVKNADGKLMVSLLKVNTIREEKPNKKRKLNLEEYKKRRGAEIFKSESNSQNTSPLSSTCSSPLQEDETVRQKKHQEKLMRMAKEVLRTPAKKEQKVPTPQYIILPQKVIQVPPDIEKITLVSVAVNTDMSGRRNLDPFSPVEQLEQIKPVLKKISDKISPNSLITSVIENIPKVIDRCSSESTNIQPSTEEHGEDKIIAYLRKDRKPVLKVDKSAQTNISLIQQSKASRYRRRRNSSTSTSTSTSDSIDSKYSNVSTRDERLTSNASTRSSVSNHSSMSSRSFISSHSSTRSYSPSRSLSASSEYMSRTERERQRLLEVEERRVVYVGRLSDNATRQTLRSRFQRFGPISTISLHSRQHGDKYGFVTFNNKYDAYNAVAHGNDDPNYPRYDLSFGGRRLFCQTTYSDLDNMRDEIGDYYEAPRASQDSFDNLLKKAQEKLRKRRA